MECEKFTKSHGIFSSRILPHLGISYPSVKKVHILRLFLMYIRHSKFWQRDCQGKTGGSHGFLFLSQVYGNCECRFRNVLLMGSGALDGGSETMSERSMKELYKGLSVERKRGRDRN